MKDEFGHRPLALAAAALIVGASTIAHPLHLIFLGLLLGIFRELSTRILLALGFLVGVMIAPGAATPLITRGQNYSGEVQVTSAPILSRFGQSCEARVG